MTNQHGNISHGNNNMNQELVFKSVFGVLSAINLGGIAYAMIITIMNII